MPAYVIADIDVHDPEAYREYGALVPGTLEPFGGRFLVRGGDCEPLEGDWRPRRLVVLEFPSADHARRWYASTDYVAAMAIRHRALNGQHRPGRGNDLGHDASGAPGFDIRFCRMAQRGGRLRSCLTVRAAASPVRTGR